MTERLALIEVLDRDGHVLRSADVLQWPFSIGRALNQQLVLDDPYVAAQHARVTQDDNGGLRLMVGDTDNGVRLQGRLHPRGSSVALVSPSTALQLGLTRLVLRQPGEALAPERPLPVQSLSSSRNAWLAALALLALVMADHALQLDPGADATAWLPVLVGTPGAIVAWCAIWALMSKLFQHRFDFLAHLWVALPWLLAIEAVEWVLPQLAAALGWPLLWRLVVPLQVLLVAILVRQHLALLLPQHARRMTLAVVMALLSGSAVILTFTHNATDRFSRPPYMSTLPLPAWQLATPQPAQALVQQLEGLTQGLQRRVAKARAEAAEAGEDPAAD